MMAVRGTIAEIEAASGGIAYEVACINGPRDLVLVGPKEQMALLAEQLQNQGHKTHRLDIPHAFHSEHVIAVAIIVALCRCDAQLARALSAVRRSFVVTEVACLCMEQQELLDTVSW